MGQVIDNAGQWSPRVTPFDIENDCMDKGQVIDNAGQRSPCNTPYNTDDECLIGGQIIDNFGQRSPHTNPFDNGNGSFHVKSATFWKSWKLPSAIFPKFCVHINICKDIQNPNF